MIYEAIHLIQQEIPAAVGAKIGNIAEILSNNNQTDEIIISLINIEENRISRNPQNFVRNGTDVIVKNPAIHLYLTLLFTSAKDGVGYELGIQKIQQVIEFFQQKPVFNHSNTPSLDPGIEKLIVELLSFNLEQLYQMWSMLGGKYYPSVAYKVRMVTIDKDEGQGGNLIKEIDSNYNLIDTIT